MHDAAGCVRRLAGLAGAGGGSRASFDWAVIECDLGLALPDDYKLIAESLPSGWFRTFVRVDTPEVSDDSPRGRRFLDEFAEGEMTTLREWQAEGGDVPYPVYPEPGGLLRWGSLREGGRGFWLTDPAGDPGAWPVVIASQQYEVWRRFDGPLCDFLVEVAEARFDSAGFKEGPDRVILEASGVRVVEQPVVLASRPVFTPDTVPEPARTAVPAPDPGFWAARQRHFGRFRPVSEMPLLRELLGAPPAGVLPRDWDQVESRLGTRLPADYKEFVDIYGPGSVGGVRVVAPGGPGGWDLFAFLDRKRRQARGHDLVPSVDPPFHPEPGGTICWGETVGGWTCCWAPAGADPDAWNAAALYPEPDLRGFALIGGVSFSAALRRYLTGEDAPLPQRDPANLPVTFEPAARLPPPRRRGRRPAALKRRASRTDGANKGNSPASFAVAVCMCVDRFPWGERSGIADVVGDAAGHQLQS